MVSSFVCRKLVVIIIAVSLALSACHGGVISGNKYIGTKYVGKKMTVEFKTDNTAYLTTFMGDTIQTKYEVDGDKVVLHYEQGNIVFTRGKDGALRSTGVFEDTLIKMEGMNGKYRTDLGNNQTVTIEFKPDNTAYSRSQEPRKE